MGNVGEEIALDLARALHRLAHAVERGAQHADLVLPPDAHAPRVVARGDVLGRGRKLSQRTRDRTAHQEDEEHRDDERRAAGFEQLRRQVARGRRRRQRLGLRDHHERRPERVARRGEGSRGREERLAVEGSTCLADVGNTFRRVDHDHRAQRLVALAVEHDPALPVEQQHPVAVDPGHDRTEPVLEDRDVGLRAARRSSVGHSPDRVGALLVADQRLRRDGLAVELVLDALKLEVAHEHPGQRAGENKADGDDSRRGGKQTKAKGQLPASSRR